VTTHAWEPVIGLEIHVQLATRTKMFCGCELAFGEPPNTRTCPVCLGHPGALPVTNGEAVRLGIVVGLALGCEIAAEAIFHRKNYFYPDLPKAYQISQYDHPICYSGAFTVLEEDGSERVVRITRAHLEEDAAKLLHLGEGGRRAGAVASVVDFNRGGTPLVEIVTEPDLRSPDEAVTFLKQLRQTFQHLGVSDCSMEEGSLRVDANVSVRPAGTQELGVKTELKNMNSFTFLRRGIAAEVNRQVELLESGGRVVQETLHFDPETGTLHSLRSKEEAHDYRYFPEPDLVPIVPPRDWVEELREGLPELPVARRRRWSRDWGLTFEDADVLSETPELADYFEEAAARSGEPKAAANLIRNELVALLRERGEQPWRSRVTPERLAGVVELLRGRTISMPVAKEVLAEVAATGADPAAVVEERGLAQIADPDRLRSIVQGVLDAHPAQAAELRGGKDKLVGFFVGQVMKATEGRADPAAVGGLVRDLVRAPR
jgi:aspartyl-tRNA(Asn)/glutamyl-tRNA(Gln) amidotransferase subunit B